MTLTRSQARLLKTRIKGEPEEQESRRAEGHAVPHQVMRRHRRAPSPQAGGPSEAGSSAAQVRRPTRLCFGSKTRVREFSGRIKLHDVSSRPGCPSGRDPSLGFAGSHGRVPPARRVPRK